MRWVNTLPGLKFKVFAICDCDNISNNFTSTVQALYNSTLLDDIAIEVGLIVNYYAKK